MRLTNATAGNRAGTGQESGYRRICPEIGPKTAGEQAVGAPRPIPLAGPPWGEPDRRATAIRLSGQPREAPEPIEISRHTAT
jgi:hypothetical protein